MDFVGKYHNAGGVEGEKGVLFQQAECGQADPAPPEST